jgi:hypothetical protein
MSAETARAILMTAAEFGEEPVRAFARRLLDHWGDSVATAVAAPSAKTRAPPMSPAERSRKWRAEQRLRRMAEGNENDTAERDDPQRTETNGRDNASRSETEIVSQSVSSHDVRVASRVAPRASACDLNFSLDPSESEEIHTDEDTQVASDQSHSLFLQIVPSATDAQRNETNARNDSRSETRRRATYEQTLLRGTRIPDDWRPSAALIEWAATEHQVDALAVAPEFVDHWRGLPGKDGFKLDWDGTFRNRVRYLVRRGEAPPLRPAGPTLARTQPAPSSLTAEERAESARHLGDALDKFRIQNAARGGT